LTDFGVVTEQALIKVISAATENELREMLIFSWLDRASSIVPTPNKRNNQAWSTGPAEPCL